MRFAGSAARTLAAIAARTARIHTRAVSGSVIDAHVRDGAGKDPLVDSHVADADELGSLGGREPLVVAVHGGVGAPVDGLGYQGAHKRPEIVEDEHLSQVQWRVAARKGVLRTMTGHDRAVETRKASVRAKVEHPFLILKRDFGFTKTRYRGIGKNLNHVHVLFASANWLMRARAVALAG